MSYRKITKIRVGDKCFLSANVNKMRLSPTPFTICHQPLLPIKYEKNSMLNKLLIALVVFFASNLNGYAAKTQVRTIVPSSKFENCVLDGGESRQSRDYVACCTGPTDCIVCKKGEVGDCQRVVITELSSFGFTRSAPSGVVGPVQETTPARNSLEENAEPVTPAKKVPSVGENPTIKTSRKSEK